MTPIEAIYRAVGTPETWPNAIAAVADYLGLDGGLVAFQPPRPHRPFLVTGRLRDDLSDLYLQQYTYNAWTPVMVRAPAGVPQLGHRLVDMAAVRRSAWYADILAPQAIEGMIAVSHPSLSWSGGSGGIAFFLSRRQLDDDEMLTRKLRPLLPHLMRAVDLSLSMGRYFEPASMLERVLDSMPGPAMLLDHEGRLSFANPAAEALLAEGDGLTVMRSERSRLTASVPSEQTALTQAVQTSLQIAKGDGANWLGAARVTRPSGRSSLAVLTTPLPTAWHPFGAAIPWAASVLVQVLGAERRPDHLADRLRRIYGLTPAEAKVAALIGRGASAPVVARALGVSLTTVKSHLGRCFDKTDMRSQAELAHLVAHLPGGFEAEGKMTGDAALAKRRSFALE